MEKKTKARATIGIGRIFYDLGELFKGVKDVEELKLAFSNTLLTENGFRGSNYSDEFFEKIEVEIGKKAE